jgi:hypothetical protein
MQRNVSGAGRLFHRPRVWPRGVMSTIPSLQNGQSLSEIVLVCARTMRLQQVTVAELSHALGDRSIEVLLLILALPMFVPIPAPGISIAFGAPMMLLAAQLAVGRRHLWLPQVLGKIVLGKDGVADGLEASLPTLKRLEHIVRPRLFWLSGRWSRIPVGVICFALAAIITLPVPLGHFVPGIAICLLALGLLERDGLVVGLGIAASLFAIVVVSLASVGAARMVNWWLH